MKKIFNILVFTILFSIYLPAKMPITQEDVPSMPIPKTSPVWVEVHSEKSVLRPGETVKLTLMNFRYQNKPPAHVTNTLIVRSSAGIIMDGTTVVLNEDEFGDGPVSTGSVKAFLLRGGEDKIEVYYRAPLRGKFSEVEIEVFAPPYYHLDADLYPTSTVTWETNSEGMPMIDKGKQIAGEILRIKWGTYLLLNYEENKRRKSGSKVVYTHEIKSVIRIDCEPWQTGSMLQIKNLEVLEFSGRADLIGSNYHEEQKAVSAKPSFYNTLVLLHLDPKTEKIQGIIYEPFELNVTWQGDEIPEGPPDVVNVGPVSKDERGPWGARWEGSKLQSELPTEGKTARKVRRMQQFLIQNFAETQVHPDHIVKKGDGKTFFAGQGKWEKSSGSNFHRKTYTWELHITK